MPIYEYACKACAHEFETIQKVSDEPLEFCPECGEQTLAKKISAAAFHLKGTGWYETDFKGKTKSGDDSTSGDSPAAEKTSGGSGDGDGGGDSSSSSSSKTDSSSSTGSSSSSDSSTAQSAA